MERGLVDIWRINNPSSREFTWKNKAGMLQSRIDFWLVSECFTNLQCTTEIIPTPLTDHKTILLTLQLSPNSEPRRCPSYWKLSSTLLFNETLCEIVKDKISEYFKLAENEGQFQKYWELRKYELRKLFMKNGARLKKEQKKQENELIAKLISFSSISPENMSESQQAQLLTL